MSLPVLTLFCLVVQCLYYSDHASSLKSLRNIVKLRPNIAPSDIKSIYLANHVKTLKLPVWPVVGGVLLQILDFIPYSKELVEKLWSTVGGRVVPITLSENDLSPFLLLAHHSHSFTPFDPFRTITKFFLPEGFPAHPHAGFDTITYTIDGGFRHRDSSKCKMFYGDGDVQWMRAGRGILHEEMWDLFSSQFQHKRIEIFQLWVNLAETSKNVPPITEVLKNDSIPLIMLPNDGFCKVICGSVDVEDRIDDSGILVEGTGNTIANSPVTILHLHLSEPNSKISLITQNNCVDNSILVYVRRGSLDISSNSVSIANKDKSKSNDDLIEIGDYAFYLPATYENDYDNIDNECELSIKAGNRGLDCLILIGEKLREPEVWRGPFVQTSVRAIQEKSYIFNDPVPVSDSESPNEAKLTSIYWDSELPDEEWLRHCDNIQLQKRLQNSLPE